MSKKLEEQFKGDMEDHASCVRHVISGKGNDPEIELKIKLKTASIAGFTIYFSYFTSGKKMIL